MDKHWKLLPVEPTNEMQQAADYWIGQGFDWPKAIYRAMVKVAPRPPSASDEREQFEAWAQTQAASRLIGELSWSPGTNDYASARTNAAFAAWQARAALASSPGVDAAEPVGSVFTMEALGCGDGVKYHAQLYRPLPSGTKLYAVPQAAPSPAASAAPEPAKRILFPTHLRKMWSGSEVQAWLDDLVGAEPIRPTARGSLARYRKWQAEQATPGCSATGDTVLGNEGAPR